MLFSTTVEEFPAGGEGDENLQQGLQYLVKGLVGSLAVQYCEPVLMNSIHVQYTVMKDQNSRRPRRATRAAVV